MARASHNKVNCPVCDENVSCSSYAHPGSKGTWFEPPEGPEIIEYGEPEYNCSCREDIESNGGYKEIRFSKEENRLLPNQTYNDLLEAYDKEVNRRVEASDYDIEWDEPDYDEDDFDRSTD